MSQTYIIEHLDDVSSGSPGNDAAGINDAGHVVGTYWSGGSANGFLEVGGVYTTVNAPGALQTYAYKIDNSGVISGTFQNGGGWHGFTDTGGVFTQIDDPQAAPGSTWVGAANNVGVYGGWYQTPSGTTHGFIYSGGVFTDVYLPGADSLQLIGINDSGVAVGRYLLGGSWHGFTFDGAGLHPFDDPDAVANGTQPYGVNDNGDIVGFYIDHDNNQFGFVDVGGVFTTVKAHLGAWTVIQDINTNGTIVGAGYSTSNSNSMVFLGLAHAPEPSSWTIMLVGALLAGVAARKKRRSATPVG